MNAAYKWLPPIEHLVEEAAAAISINGINYAVMMVTPDNIEDFAIGFLFSEAIIQHDHDVHDIQITPSDNGFIIEVTISNRCLYALNSKKRRLVGATGCGICGVEAIEHALPQLSILPITRPIDITDVESLKQRITDSQIKAQQSGAIHAALGLTAQGDIVACREDIGRHNALDKLIGMLLRQTTTTQETSCNTLLITSRCSSELIHKAVLFGANNLISLASPSQLAVKLALQYNLNIIHIPKYSAPIYYSNYDAHFDVNRLSLSPIGEINV
ncbi:MULTISPECIES: formate dehydrogenase accessory sulfurtransferase FdhD [Shewanella]|jgi:FdhD protein|uniref:formate dehydrogenase accessory sulfurtransferase FdhD n=1 Tax=Shewanella TaxID=22 RepID=UPI000C3ED9BA|nr:MULTISPECIES: formate dehydrogenase accessory sulfurtransferase FdhD [Shewanella]NCQ44191.1 formate dehydrogenase accessory sulfurtransferase FdhD [Shewanella frigidimarina]MBB1475028.1 formate dehydrogenase accessory sulfurtransferase FdhD [Shewanella sp. SG41-3]NCO71118.1 formate dehydrogenase accessory sulfurtransferase FdhD [Shewanella vesiculosa]NCP35152.1 formate dehydrogenase accessory sulfurtransferase FdhD [Shewanella vesiculosa]NCP69827.1 formate dehydrogenase accessory sulfurtran|tara:strand:+ start:2024 stop:2839 length:816 start_codon:yes stop_codon:yes gene_type:complete